MIRFGLFTVVIAFVLLPCACIWAQALPTPEQIRSTNWSGSRLKWMVWEQAPQDARKFVLTKDPTLPQIFFDKQKIDVAIADLDGDKKNDVMLFLWDKRNCNDKGCTYVVQYANPKQNLGGEFYASKFSFYENNFLVDDYPYNIVPQQSPPSLIDFSTTPNGIARRLVENAWRQDPEYKEYVEAFHVAPDHVVTLADLNRDGSQEILALHTDRSLVFCPDDTPACRLHIYSYNAGQLKEIGRMFSTRTILYGDDPFSRHRALKVQSGLNEISTYIWNGRQYQQRSAHDKS